jgi:hypothetical protein
MFVSKAHKLLKSSAHKRSSSSFHLSILLPEVVEHMCDVHVKYEAACLAQIET